MHSAIFCILFPCASGNVSPNNGFNCVLTYVILEYDDTEMKKNLKKNPREREGITDLGKP